MTKHALNTITFTVALLFMVFAFTNVVNAQYELWLIDRILNKDNQNDTPFQQWRFQRSVSDTTNMLKAVYGGPTDYPLDILAYSLRVSGNDKAYQLLENLALATWLIESGSSVQNYTNSNSTMQVSGIPQQFERRFEETKKTIQESSMVVGGSSLSGGSFGHLSDPSWYDRKVSELRSFQFQKQQEYRQMFDSQASAMKTNFANFDPTKTPVYASYLMSKQELERRKLEYQREAMMWEQNFRMLHDYVSNKMGFGFNF